MYWKVHFLPQFQAPVEIIKRGKVGFQSCAFLFWQGSIFGLLKACNQIILLLSFEYFIQSKDLEILLILLQQCLWALVVKQGLIVLHTVQVQGRKITFAPERFWTMQFWYPNAALDFKTILKSFLWNV